MNLSGSKIFIQEFLHGREGVEFSNFGGRGFIKKDDVIIRVRGRDVSSGFL